MRPPQRRDWAMLYYVLSVPVILLIIAAVSYASWRVQRGCNFTYGYEEKVQETVRAMVKPECLKVP